jgi:hypothetical protein
MEYHSHGSTELLLQRLYSCERRLRLQSPENISFLQNFLTLQIQVTQLDEFNCGHIERSLFFWAAAISQDVSSHGLFLHWLIARFENVPYRRRTRKLGCPIMVQGSHCRKTPSVY